MLKVKQIIRFLVFPSLLLISFVIGYCVLAAIDQTFLKLQEARIFPLGFVPQLEGQQTRTSQKEVLLMLGDSRISMWPQKLWPSKYDVINIGHGGQTSSQVALQLKTQHIPRGKFAFVQVCVNDLHSLGGMPEHQDYVVNQCKRNLSSIVDSLQNLGYIVIISTIFPPSHPPFNRARYWPGNFEMILDDINSYIRSLGSESVKIFDSYAMLKDAESAYLDARYADADFFLHINAVAYEYLTKQLNEVLF